MKKLFGFSLLFLTMGCEKSVDFKLDQTLPKLVVDASIENGEPPIVILSKSLNYFSKINPQLLAESFVHNAMVEISNGTKTHKLKEYEISLANGYAIYYYSIDSADLPSSFIGELNTNYKLQIIAEGETYTASTTIPNITKRIDSLRYKPTPNDTSNKKVTVMLAVTDPPGYGDYIRYWTKRNQEIFLPGFQSVHDDLIIDGTTYEVEVQPGINRNEEFNEDKWAFKKGDTVTLKLSNINKTTYDFWRTMEYTYASVGNPFASPVKVLGNISNNALGYFAGYASQYRTIIIPR
ncbi:MAG: DUF4249 domain-containing protein [Chitinophagaceae bacterium]